MYKKVIFTGQTPSKYEQNDVCTIHIHELKQLQETGRYPMEIIGETKSEAPDDSWSKVEIQKYLDDNGVEYKTKDSKVQLLEKV